MERNQKLTLYGYICYICTQQIFSKWWINNTSYKKANIFNDFLSTIAGKTKSKITFPKKHFFEFLKTKNSNTFYIYLATKEEICNITSSVNLIKTTGLFSIPMKILKLLKKDISSQLNDIFNLSVATGVFPTNLITAKVIPVHKKESKRNFSN